MPPPGAVPVALTAGERKTLKKRTHGAKTPYRDRLRAQIVLAAARGRDNARIARDLRASAWTRHASGGAGSPPAAWRA
jgi:hypothetical protein